MAQGHSEAKFDPSFISPLSLPFFPVPAFLPFHFAFLSSFLSLFPFNTTFRIRKTSSGSWKSVLYSVWLSGDKYANWLWLQHDTELSRFEAWPDLTCQVRETLLLLFFIALAQFKAQLGGSHCLPWQDRDAARGQSEVFLNPLYNPLGVGMAQCCWELTSSKTSS